MDENYNKQHAATIDFVERAIVDAWENMKVWVTTNADHMDYIVRVIDKLRDALRKTIPSGKAIDYATALNEAINGAYAALEQAGLDMTGFTASDLGMFINSLSSVAGAYIYDANGVKWTTTQWIAKREELGHDPAQQEGIILVNPDHNIRIASEDLESMMWGTNSHTLVNLNTYSGGVTGTPRSGWYNQIQILAQTEPDLLRDRGYVIDYEEGLLPEDITDDIFGIFFPDDATRAAFAALIVSGFDHPVYAYIPHASVQGAYILKHIGGQQIEAKIPYTDNYGVTGCQPARSTWNHREHSADETEWRMHSVWEGYVIYLNQDAINSCRTALNKPSLPKENVWTDLLSGGSSACCVSLSSGSATTNYKNLTCKVVVVAS